MITILNNFYNNYYYLGAFGSSTCTKDCLDISSNLMASETSSFSTTSDSLKKNSLNKFHRKNNTLIDL